MTVADLVEAGRRLYYSEGLTLQAVVEKLATEAYPPEVEERIRHVGISYLIKNQISNDRNDRAGRSRLADRPAIAYTPRGREGQAIRYHRLASVYYDGADGTPRSLLDFTVADWHHRAVVEKSVMVGAKERYALALAALEALRVEGKAVTSKLSRQTLTNLEELATKVYRTAEGSAVNDGNRGGAVESQEAAS